MFLIIGRTFKESLSNFLRNGWLSFATTSILMLSLYVVGVIFMVTFTANGLLHTIQEKTNISIYFKADVAEEDILQIQGALESFGIVKSVEYVSKETALENFKRSNADEAAILQSLDELGGNPLLSSLVIKSNDPTQYQAISDYIAKAPFGSDISRVNYGKNKEVIDRLNSIIATIKRVGVSLGIFFAAISVLIIFNAIRITIYSHREEIEIMRLVGASNTYIRLPFIFEGLLYGSVATLVSLAVLYVSARFAAPYVSTAIPSSNLVAAYLSNFWLLLGIQLAIGVVLGIFSSVVAIRKYLKI